MADSAPAQKLPLICVSVRVAGSRARKEALHAGTSSYQLPCECSSSLEAVPVRLLPGSSFCPFGVSVCGSM